MGRTFLSKITVSVVCSNVNHVYAKLTGTDGLWGDAGTAMPIVFLPPLPKHPKSATANRPFL